MKAIDLTIPLGVGTPPWPTYIPLQVQYFKRLPPNGANGQVVTHSNHVGTHLDGEIHFYTPGKDMAELELDYLMHEAAIVDLSDAAGDYDVYTSEMVDERVEVKEGIFLIIHTGYHHYGWDQPEGDEDPYLGSRGSPGPQTGGFWPGMGQGKTLRTGKGLTGETSRGQSPEFNRILAGAPRGKLGGP